MQTIQSRISPAKFSSCSREENRIASDNVTRADNSRKNRGRGRAISASILAFSHRIGHGPCFSAKEKRSRNARRCDLDAAKITRHSHAHHVRDPPIVVTAIANHPRRLACPTVPFRGTYAPREQENESDQGTRANATGN